MRDVTLDDAVKVIGWRGTILVGGSGGGHAVPGVLMAVVERQFSPGARTNGFAAASARKGGRTAVKWRNRNSSQ